MQFAIIFLILLPGFPYKQKEHAFDIRGTQKSLVEISEGLYASKYEVTNHQYTSFVRFIRSDKDIFEQVKVDSMGWVDNLINCTPYVKYYHTHPVYRKYPAVNISYEGAVLYCEWLTQQYNKQPKRKINKVKFRLPTEAEWMKAAKGNDPAQTIYPWCGKNSRDKRQDPLCNMYEKRLNGPERTGDDRYTWDSAFFTAEVDVFSHNDLGIYNMAGNVAEMVQEKGLSKGGSWADTEEFVRIKSMNNYTESGPTLGFRFFMEVIEKD